MKYLIISFKARNDVYGFERLLREHNIFSNIINTPKSIGSSCMLSLKTDFRNLNSIVQILNRIKLKSFLGVFSVEKTTLGEQTLRLV